MYLIVNCVNNNDYGLMLFVIYESYFYCLEDLCID